MTFRVRPMTADDGAAISLWRYPGSWAVYDTTEAPDPAEGFWAVADESGSLVGFACFGTEARAPGLAEKVGVLDVGVGMRPDLVGQGRGAAFAEAVFAHARTALQAGSPLGTPRLRAVVQTWNERSLRLLARAGFEVVGRHVVEKQQYAVLERDA